MSFPKTTRYGVDPLDDEELANKRYVDGQAGAGLDLTTKGDLHGFDTVDKRIAIGTNGQVLTADSGEALGLKWAAAGGGSGQTFGRVVKKVDETVNNSETLQDDDELFMALDINAVYGFYLMVIMNSGAVPDFKYDFNVPSGAAGIKISGSWSSSGESVVRNFGSDITVTTDAQNEIVNCTGRCTMGGTAGNLQMEWAQENQTVADTKVILGSYLVVWKEI